MGLNGVDNGRFWFDEVRVPREALLDRFAQIDADGGYASTIDNPNRRFFTMLGTLVQGRVSVAGAGVSVAKVGAHARRPLRGGPAPVRRPRRGGAAPPRLRHPPASAVPAAGAHLRPDGAQEVLTDRLHQVFTGDVDDERTRRELESRAAGTKALATWHATRTMQECREACGGAGYLAANRFDRLKADTDVFTTFEGDNHVLLQLVAKGLLTDYRSDFSDLDQLGMVRFVASQAVGTVLERSRAHQLLDRVRDLLPGRRRVGPGGGPLDPSYQLSMLRYREAHLLDTLARRLKAAVDAGAEPAAVFSRMQAARDRDGPGARGAAGRSRRSSSGSRRCPRVTCGSRSGCSATCTRCR